MLPVQFFVPSLFPRFVFRRQSTFSGCLNTSRMRILKCMLIFDRARGCWVFVVCLLLTDICEGATLVFVGQFWCTLLVRNAVVSR